MYKITSRLLLLLGLASAILFTGCLASSPRFTSASAPPRDHSVSVVPVPPVGTDALKTTEGVASYYGYGDKYNGKTASGEQYDKDKLTAAHRTYPFGTRLRVVNLDNGRSCEVVVNDRGPFVHDRIIDLSYAAAVEIGMIGAGTARVRLEALEWGK